MDSSTQLVHLTLTEVAERIHKHLVQMEREYRAAPKQEEKGAYSGSTYYNAGASRNGSKVSVRYVSYQHSSNLSREQALHYLAALDKGYKGRHYELFRESPLPEPEQAEARFTALVRDGNDFYLYEVTRRTPSRIYGRRADKSGWSAQFVERRKVLKMRAAPEDLELVKKAQAERDAAMDEARRKFEGVVAALKSRAGESDVDETESHSGE